MNRFARLWPGTGTGTETGMVMVRLAPWLWCRDKRVAQSPNTVAGGLCGRGCGNVSDWMDRRLIIRLSYAMGLRSGELWLLHLWPMLDCRTNV